MSGSGDLQVMVPGKKITSVFGFGIIDNFTESCFCLEERICMYINSIAQIVHSDTHAYYGAANKNIGSAFLLGACWCWQQAIHEQASTAFDVLIHDASLLL